MAILYDELSVPVLRYLRARERNAADDLASELWLIVAQRLANFEGDEAAFRAWVFTIARHRLADSRRRERSHRLDAATASRLTGSLESPEPETVLLDQLSAQEAIDRIRGLLPKDQAEVVILRVVGGLDVAEVARIVGKRPGTVRVLQHRALRTLGRTLGAAVVAGTALWVVAQHLVDSGYPG